jgi:hypothetical protein
MGKLETSQPDGAYVPVDAVFSDAPISAEVFGSGLGERLRQARIAATLTLDSASARTRIKRDFLDALETMDPRGLPSRAYAIGYLRTYANFLGLDAAECVEQFKAEVECDAGRATPTAPQEKREIQLPRGTIGAVVLLGVVIVGAGWYGNYLNRSQAYAGVDAPVSALLSDETPLVSDSQFSAPTPEAIWSALPAPANTGALTFEAAAPVEIEVRDASGRILAARELDVGEVYRAPDEPGLTVSASDAGALLVRAAGRPLGPLGEAGQAVDNVSAAEFILAALRSDSEAER